MRIKLFSGRINSFEEKSNFKNLKDFNTHFENWMIDTKSKFTKSELVALKRLVRFSAKIPGISNAKVQTIVAATHEDGIGISRRTFFRMLDKAKNLGLLTVEQTKHKSNGKQAHNIFIFQKYVQETKIELVKTTIGTPELTQTGTPRNHPSFESSDLINNNVKPVPYLDYTYVGDFIPKTFINLVKPFFDDADTIEKFYSKYILAVKKYNKTADPELTFSTDTLLEVGIDSFKQTIRKLKKNQIRKDKFAFFYGVVKEKILDFAIDVEGALTDKEHLYNMVRG